MGVGTVITHLKVNDFLFQKENMKKLYNVCPTVKENVLCVGK